jgi:hypothetical protein
MLCWLSRRKTALWGALVLVFAMTGTAGATAGAMLHLGVVNTRHATTTLTGSLSGPEMRITNNGSGPALALKVDSNRPALSVSSKARVPNLNADRIDNLDGSQLQRRVSGTCVEGSAISHVSADGSVSCEWDDIDGGNAATLGGIAASGFYAAGSKVKDSLDADHADAADSAKFATSAGNAATVGGLAPSAFMSSKITLHITGPLPNPAGSTSIGSSDCGSGSLAISGGVAPSISWEGISASTPSSVIPLSTQSITSSGPAGRRWIASITNHGERDKTFEVYALCVPGSLGPGFIVPAQDTAAPESAP